MPRRPGRLADLTGRHCGYDLTASRRAVRSFEAPKGQAGLAVRAMSVPFVKGLGGRQGARAVNAERADLGDRLSVLVVGLVGVALQAESRPSEQSRPLWGRLWLGPYAALSGHVTEMSEIVGKPSPL